DGAGAQFQRQRVGAAGEIEFADLEDSTNGCLNFAGGGIVAAGQPLDFEPAPIGDGVALGFFDQDDYVFVGVRPGGVLRFDRHAIEDPEVVKLALRIHYVAFAQGRVFLDADPPPNHARTRMFVTGDQNVPHAPLPAFVDVIGQLHQVSAKVGAVAIFRLAVLPDSSVCSRSGAAIFRRRGLSFGVGGFRGGGKTCVRKSLVVVNS